MIDMNEYRKQVVRPHSARDTATSPNGTTDLPRKDHSPGSSARDAQGGSTVEGKRLGGTSETQTKITQTDMTTEEKAKAYAENIFGNPITPRGIEETRVARNAYLAGATEALASQWKDPKVELPEDDRQVLVETNCEDKELRHAISYFLAGAWHFPDDWYYDCRVLKWMYIPPLKGGDE